MIDWDRALVNINVDEKVFILSKTTLNILSSFISNETITVDDKDPLGLQKVSSKIKTKFIKAIKIVKTIITRNT